MFFSAVVLSILRFYWDLSTETGTGLKSYRQSQMETEEVRCKFKRPLHPWRLAESKGGKKKKKKSEWKSSGKWQHWKIQTLWSAEEPQPSTQEPAEPSSVWRGPAWQWASLTCSWKALLLTWRPGQATQLLNIEGKMRCGKWQNLLDGWVKKFQIFGQQGVTVSLTDPQYNTF